MLFVICASGKGKYRALVSSDVRLKSVPLKDDADDYAYSRSKRQKNPFMRKERGACNMEQVTGYFLCCLLACMLLDNVF